MGLEVLAFPCNNFGSQEPGTTALKRNTIYRKLEPERLKQNCNLSSFTTVDKPGINDEIQDFVKAKGITFPVLGKLDCAGSNKSSPLYKYLTKVFQPLTYSILTIIV